MKTRNKIMAGAAGAAAAAAAAGYYFYASSSAKKNRKLAAKWASELKDDVMKKAKDIKGLNKQSMMAIVDGVAKAYKGVSNLDQTDIMNAATELKDNWQKLREELKQTGALAKKEAQKTMKNNAKSMRKTAKKVTSKVRRAMA